MPRPGTAHYYETLTYQQLADRLCALAGKFALGLATASTRSCWAGLAFVVRDRADQFTEPGACVDYRPLAALVVKTEALA